MPPYKSALLILIFLATLTPAFGGGLLISKDNLRLWYLLLHFKGHESSVDDPSFFLHPEGKRKPLKELSKSIEVLKENPKLRCRFPARALFIERFLHKELPRATCPELDEYMEEVKGHRLSIVFADSHINSPASMFGHTFLRLYDKERDLYSYIINYAAQVDDSGGFAYAFKGLFGFYKGYFSVAPYYSKIREYTGIEGRDLWEYELRVGDEDLLLLKLHLWELKDTYSYYYFFHENCSSEVFYLLNFVSPSGELKLRTPWTVPVDTLKELIDKDMVVRISYEASILSKLKTLKDSLSEESVALIKAWVKGRAGIPEDKGVEFYEFAANYLRFLRFGGSLGIKEYRKKYLQALRERSKTKGKPQKPEGIPDPPHISHGSQRLGLGAGVDRFGNNFLTLLYRPVYHDLLDPPSGYKRNAEITFSEIALRYYPDEKTLRLDSWKLIKITSLEPVLPFYKPMSWKVDFGVYRILDEKGREKEFLFLNTGGGYTASLKGVSLFLIPEVRLASRDRYTPLVAGVGGEAGALLQGKWLSFMLSSAGGKYLHGFGKENFVNLKGTFSLHTSLHLSLRVQVNYKRVGNEEMSEATLNIFAYF